MDTSSYFIKDKALFGSYPSENAVKELELNGVKYFVNLTCDYEDKISLYHTDNHVINYQIKDRSIPDDLLSFSKFILFLSAIIKNLEFGDKIYIHCKGGHGRSGLVVACLVCNLFNYSAYESLKYTSKCHSNRLVMRDKWRRIGSPQTYIQKKFVYQLFRPINYTRMCKGIFSINSTDETYTVDGTMYNSIYDGLKKNLPVDVLYRNKLEQNACMRDYLLHTYLKPIVSYDSNNKLSHEICEFLTSVRLSYLI
jgi:hypothetical protein